MHHKFCNIIFKMLSAAFLKKYIVCSNSGIVSTLCGGYWIMCEKAKGCVMVNEVPREVPRLKTKGVAGLKGFWPLDLPRDYIHHDTLKAFPHNVIILSSQISIWDLFQPKDPLGSVMVNIPPRLLQTLTVLNPI